MPSALFDRHHAMLRFVIVFAVGVALIAASLTLGIVGRMTADRESFSQNPLYTSTVKIADGIEGRTVGMWGSSDGRRVFIAFKLDDDSVQKMPADASRYSVTVAAVDRNLTLQKMLVVPSASVYMFGSTGYMGLYLVAGEQYQPQYYQAYIQCKDTAGDDVAFSIVFNPAATGITHSDVLDADSFDPSSLYRQAVAVSDETTLRKKMYDDLGQMYSSEQTILEYQDRLDKAGVSTTGKLPQLLSGDNIQEERDDDGKLTGYKVDLATTVPGGVTLDWQGCSITNDDAYIAAAERATRTSSYDDMIAALASTYSDQDKPAVATDPSQWYMKDGRTVSAAQSSISSSTYADITSSISQYATACGAYYDAKSSYQTTDAMALIAFENDVRSVASSITSADVNVYAGK